MDISEPFKVEGKSKINILNITDDEIVWLRSAIKAYQDKNDPDDFNALKRARDWMDNVHAAFKKMRPS